jgi:hypothetical protein
VVGPWKVVERPNPALTGDSERLSYRVASSLEEDGTRPCDLIEGLTGSGSGSGSGSS